MKTIVLNRMMLRKTRHQIEAIIHEVEAELKLKILTKDEIKVKALKGLYFQQQITKIEAKQVTPMVFVKNMIKTKENFFQKVGKLQKK